METASINAPVARSRRRPVAKPSAAPQKVKTAVHLSPESFRRLGIAAVMEGRTQSDIIDKLISDALRRYVVSDRGDRPSLSLDTGEDRQDVAA